MELYKKPKNIENDMGGKDGMLDSRMREIFDLLEYIPEKAERILDVGFGGGQIPYYFLKQGKVVASIGLKLSSYGIDVKKVREDGIDLREENIENTSFNDGEFDCIIASHTLEHVYNFGNAIMELKRILKMGGCW